MYKVTKIGYEDIETMARLHVSEIERGLLARLGLNFLKLFYRHFVESKYAFGIAIKEEGKMQGFITATLDDDAFYTSFYKKYFFKILGYVLIGALKNPVILFHAIERVLFNKKETKKLPEAVSMAIIPESQKKGYAILLLNKLVEEYKKRNVKRIKITVGKETKPLSERKKSEFANKFYTAYGFKLVETYKLNGIYYNKYILNIV